MAQNITLMGASYSAVPSVTLPKTGGGTASFTDVSDTTSTADDVASGTYFYTAAGVRTEGTSSGGGGVQTVAVTISGDLYYTDANMQYQHQSVTLTNEQIPLNTIIVRNGPAEPGAPQPSGVTQQFAYRSIYVFTVTG